MMRGVAQGSNGRKCVFVALSSDNVTVLKAAPGRMVMSFPVEEVNHLMGGIEATGFDVVVMVAEPDRVCEVLGIEPDTLNRPPHPPSGGH